MKPKTEVEKINAKIKYHEKKIDKLVDEKRKHLLIGFKIKSDNR